MLYVDCVRIEPSSWIKNEGLAYAQGSVDQMYINSLCVRVLAAALSDSDDPRRIRAVHCVFERLEFREREK